MQINWIHVLNVVVKNHVFRYKQYNTVLYEDMCMHAVCVNVTQYESVAVAVKRASFLRNGENQECVLDTQRSRTFGGGEENSTHLLLSRWFSTKESTVEKDDRDRALSIPGIISMRRKRQQTSQ